MFVFAQICLMKHFGWFAWLLVFVCHSHCFVVKSEAYICIYVLYALKKNKIILDRDGLEFVVQNGLRSYMLWDRVYLSRSGYSFTVSESVLSRTGYNLCLRECVVQSWLQPLSQRMCCPELVTTSVSENVLSRAGYNLCLRKCVVQNWLQPLSQRICCPELAAASISVQCIVQNRLQLLSQGVLFRTGYNLVSDNM